MRPRILEETDVDPFERIPEEEVVQEDVPGLSIDHDDSDKDEDIIIE